MTAETIETQRLVLRPRYVEDAHAVTTQSPRSVRSTNGISLGSSPAR